MNLRISGCWVRLFCLLGCLALPLDGAWGWVVQNQTSVSLRARVSPGDWDVEIAPGGEGSCHWSNTGCNPGGSQGAVVSLQVETLDGDPRKLTLIVSMVAGGSATIIEETRPTQWLSPGHISVSTYGVNGDFFRVQPADATGATRRNIHFLISADCQFCDLSDCPGDEMPVWNANAVALHQHMLARAVADSTIRGVCYAGDLTQFASAAELDIYLDSIAGYSRFVYDGLGNHDLAYGRTRVRDAVRDRKRTTVRTQDGDPHYSWDWHDVHFVQLNLMPANAPAPNVQGINVDFASLDPMGALNFLIADLALHVGNSGRPVILMHHYGFDNFSIGVSNGEIWWTEAQRLEYWNAIAAYNVVGIFTGHLHPEPTQTDSLNRFVTWNRPAGAVTGPASIPTFVSGAARNGAYLDVEFNSANQLFVQVRTKTGTVTGSQCYLRPTPIWIAPTAPLVGRGWKDDPFDSFAEAMNAAAARIGGATCLSPLADFRVKPGNYSGTPRLATPGRLSLDGSGQARLAR